MQTSDDTGRRSSGTTKGAVIALAIVLALVVAGALVWWRWETVAEWLGISDDAQSTGPEVGVNLSEVSDHPDPLYGRRVVVSGSVDQVAGPNAILIGSDEFVVGDEVLVVSRSPFGDLPGSVQVTGEVRRYQRDRLAQDLGIELSDELSYGGKAVIVASSVTAAPPPTIPGDTERADPSAGQDDATSIDDITDGVDDLAGQEVTVSGEIERILGPQAIRFGDAMLLAVGPLDEEPFIEAMAEVTGVVARFDLEQAEQTLGIDLDDDLSQFEGEPVILVHDLNVVR